MLQTQTREPTEVRDENEAAATATTTPGPPAEHGELFFQRCRWCGTPAFRRASCRACGSMALGQEPSAGTGVVVRRHGPTPHNTWVVAMDEGFTLVCQITRTEPAGVAVGARVMVVRASGPHGQGFPSVELVRQAPALERWW